MKRLGLIFAASVTVLAVGVAAVYGLGRTIDRAIDDLLRP